MSEDDRIYNEALGDAIQSLRDQMRPKVTNEEIADRSGVPLRTIEHILAGSRGSRARNVYRVIRAIGLDASAVLSLAEVLYEKRIRGGNTE